MTLRFTSTAKWEDDYFLGLGNTYQLFWLYLCDRCDEAGVWQVSEHVVSERFKGAVSMTTALAKFGDRVRSIKDGRYWFLVKFVAFQQPKGLNLKCPAHRKIIAVAQAHGIDLSQQGVTITKEGGGGIGVGPLSHKVQVQVSLSSLSKGGEGGAEIPDRLVPLVQAGADLFRTPTTLGEYLKATEAMSVDQVASVASTGPIEWPSDFTKLLKAWSAKRKANRVEITAAERSARERVEISRREAEALAVERKAYPECQRLCEALNQHPDVEARLPPQVVSRIKTIRESVGKGKGASLILRFVLKEPAIADLMGGKASA